MVSVIPLWVTHGVVLLGLLIGSITDLKKREVPDYLNFSLMIIGLFFGVISSIFSQSIWPFLAACAGLFVGYIIGAIMFYGGQWGGGDSKMLMGIGALLGIDLLAVFTSTLGSYIPLLFIVIISILICGSIYGMFFMIYLVVKHWKTFKKAFVKKIQTKTVHQTRKIISLVVLICILVGLAIQDSLLRITIILIGGVIFGLFYLLIITKTIEQYILTKQMRTKDLTEGEWIVKEVTKKTKQQSPVQAIKRMVSYLYYKKDEDKKKKTVFVNKHTKKIINDIVIETYTGNTPLIRLFKYAFILVNKKKHVAYRKKIIFALHLQTENSFNAYIAKNNISRLKKVIKNKHIYFDNIYICGPKDLGILESQIEALQKNKIKKVLVKQGIPFIPGFLIGYVVIVLFFEHIRLILTIF